MKKDNDTVKIIIEKEVRIPVSDDNDIILEVGDIIEVLPKIEEGDDKKTVLKKEFHERMKKRLAELRKVKEKEEKEEKDKDDKKKKDDEKEDDDKKKKDDKKDEE